MCCSDSLLVDFTPCLCPPFNLSLCFRGDVPCVQLSCVQYTTPPPIPLPSLSLAFLRTRLIAGAKLYIQVNSWDGWPLLNAYVLCLYRIHSLLSTFWMLAWLYPLGPSKFVRLNFEVLCVELWPGSVYWSYWHFVALRWQNTTVDVSIKHGKSFVLPTWNKSTICPTVICCISTSDVQL